MNAATFLSFAGLLVLVSMSKAVIITTPGTNPKGRTTVNFHPSSRSLYHNVFDVFRIWNNSAGGVAFIGQFDTNTIITAYKFLNPRIPEKVLNPILSVPESSMILSSVEIPIRNFSINDMKLWKLPTSTQVIHVSFVIPEIRVDFLSPKRPKNRPRGDPIKLQYSLQQINVKMEIYFSHRSRPGDQYVTNAAVEKFEPQKMAVRGFEGKSQFSNSIPVKGSKQFKDIMAVATYHIPAIPPTGIISDILRDFAQKFYF